VFVALTDESCPERQREPHQYNPIPPLTFTGVKRPGAMHVKSKNKPEKRQ